MQNEVDFNQTHSTTMVDSEDIGPLIFMCKCNDMFSNLVTV